MTGYEHKSGIYVELFVVGGHFLCLLSNFVVGYLKVIFVDVSSFDVT